MRLATSAQMKQIEQNAANGGLSYYDMMENAGRAVVESMIQKLDPANKRIFVFAGKGNNGGDGFVAARILFQAGANVKIVLVDGEPESPDAVSNFQLVRQLGVEVLDLVEHGKKITALLKNVDVLLDAIYGTGFHGAFNERASQAAQMINSAIAAVFSLDLPSGINADTGELAADAVKADFTITFDSLKPAHLMYPALEQCGKIELADIGIEDALRADVQETFARISEEMVFTAIPQRAENSHKGTYGRLLNIGSSQGMTGAGQLSVWGAQRVGTGLITLAAPSSLLSIHAAKLTEATFLPLQETEEGTISAFAMEQLAPRLEQATAVLVGCGLGVNRDTTALVESLLRTAKCPLVIDADGINALAKNINVLGEAEVPLVLTPHPAEMARMLQISTEELLAHKVPLGQQFAQKHEVVLVLKGANTLVFTPEGNTLVNTTGNNGLAKGGSGDILAGMIAGFLAQGMSARDSAMCGVYLHGRAADLCAKRLSRTAMQPSDLLQDLCTIFLDNDR